MKSPLLLSLVTGCLLLPGTLLSQTQLYINALNGTSAATLDASPSDFLAGAFVDDPTNLNIGYIPSGINGRSYTISNASASPQGGNALYGRLENSNSTDEVRVLDNFSFSLGDLLDSNGNTASLVSGESYIMSFWYLPTVFTDNNGNSWSLLPAQNSGKALLNGNLFLYDLAPFSPNTWTKIDIPLLYDASTMNSSTLISDWGFTALPTAIQLSGTGGQVPEPSNTHLGAVDFGSPINIPEPSGALLIGIFGILGILRQRR